MKGNKKIIAVLNDLLSDELTAISQYFLHAEMCSNWGYEKIHKAVEKRAIAEMKHAEKLIERILFLEGMPGMDKLKKMFIGKDVKAQFQNDLSAEIGAVKAYNDGIQKAVEADDNGTRALLEAILSDEEEHLDWLEMQLDLIKQVGIENYLATQIEEE
jgi:bacterioferritin